MIIIGINLKALRIVSRLLDINRLDCASDVDQGITIATLPHGLLCLD